ncbi:MAG: hypothetical protein AB1644_08395 [Candidatus Zixiibacteriota bacterium]
MTTHAPAPFAPRTAADALALEIAVRFGDIARLSLYRQICGNHDRSVVYRAFREAMAVPADQVKKSRRALFLFILHAYDHRPHAPRP